MPRSNSTFKREVESSWVKSWEPRFQEQAAKETATDQVVSHATQETKVFAGEQELDMKSPATYVNKQFAPNMKERQGRIYSLEGKNTLLMLKEKLLTSHCGNTSKKNMGVESRSQSLNTSA